MTEHVENLLLEHMKRMQAEMALARDRHAEVLARFNQIETIPARVVRDVAQNYAERIEDRHAVDALRERVERIERRLELSM